MKKYNHFLNVIKRISDNPEGNINLSRYIRNVEYSNRYMYICREAFTSTLEVFWDNYGIKDKPYINHMLFTPPSIDPYNSHVTKDRWNKIDGMIHEMFKVNDTNFNILYNTLALYIADQVNIMILQNNPCKHIKNFNNVDISLTDMSTEISKSFFDMVLMAAPVIKNEIDIIRTSAEM